MSLLHDRSTVSASDIKPWLTWLVAIVLDVMVFQMTLGWSLSGRVLAGFASGSLWLAGTLPRHTHAEQTWLAGTWLLLSALAGGIMASALASGLPAIVAATLTSAISLALLQQGSLHRQQWQNVPRLCLLAVAYLVALRLSYLGIPELIFEEAYYWDYAQHLDYGYLDHPLVTALIIKTSTLLFGHHEFAVRFGAFLCWFVTGYYVYRLTSLCLDTRQAAIALLLAAAMPAYFFFGFFMSPDAPLTACWAAALYYSYRILHQQSASAWYGLGVSLGIGMSSKYTIALLGAGIVILLLADPQLRRWWLRKEPYLALLIVLLCFSPVIFWNLQHDWASFTFQSEERAKSSFVFSTPRFLGNILLFATPIGVLSLLGLLTQRKVFSTQLRQLQADIPALNVKSLWQLTFLGLFPILLFGALSIARTSKLNWTGPCWLALLPVFSLLVSSRLQPAGLLKTSQRSWPTMLGILLLIYALGMHYLSIGYPGIAYPQNMHLLGWKPAGATIDNLARDEARRSGKPVLVVGMDRNRTASGMAFYRGVAEHSTGNVTAAANSTTSQNLFGYNGLMFGWWFDKQAQAGKTLLLVGDDRDDLNARIVQQHCQSLGDIHSLPTFKQGKKTGLLYYRFAYNYKP